MKVLKESNFSSVFPMKIKCEQVRDIYGFSYGKKIDFCGSELEIEADDIIKHSWSKYPDYEGVDYGVKCPVCGRFSVVDKNKIPEVILKKAVETRLHS